MNLQDKIAVVVGAGSGIGLATANHLLSQGATVYFAGRTLGKLQAVTQGTEGRPITLNLEDEASIRAAFAQIGALDYLVFTAADLSYAPLSDLQLVDARRVFESKFFGPLAAVQAALPHFRAGGSVVFFSGLAAWRPGPGTSMVSAVNGALAALTAALAVELAPLRVNAISPGIVVTPSWDGMPRAERQAFFDQTAASLPARRVGQPEDLAQAVEFLLTNPFTTGTVLHVDGGGRVA